MPEKKKGDLYVSKKKNRKATVRRKIYLEKIVREGKKKGP